MQQSQQDDDIKVAAISTLYSGLSFVRDNMEREGERNFIMQVVCESTQHHNPKVQVPAYSCLVRIMQLYYEKMKFYMEKALFGLTVMGMRSSNPDVATQAVEFWSSVCEEELDITSEIAEALEMGEQPERENYNFAKTALMEVLPQILLLLFRQEEDDDDEWTVANSAAAAVALFAQIAENAVLGPVLQFVEANIRGELWNAREAAVMAFGSVMDGPDPSTLQPLVAQAFPVLIAMLGDPSSAVRESTSWALARATELVPKGFQPDTHLRPLMEGLVATLRDSRNNTIQNCAWTIQNICGVVGATKPSETSTPLGPYYEPLVTELMAVTQRCIVSILPANCRTDAELQGGRNACWEAICKLTEESGLDSINSVQNLTKIALDRLEASIAMRKQAVGMDDRLIAEEQQVQLCAVLNVYPNRTCLNLIELSSTNRCGGKTCGGSHDDDMYSIIKSTASCGEPCL
jgi:importin subunit beta-1